MNDNALPPQHALAASEPTGLEPVVLTLLVNDSEMVEALAEHSEGRARIQFAMTALKVGILALRAAKGSLDAAAVRSESERLLAILAERLDTHRDSVDRLVAATLSSYFDPKSGKFSDRVARLVSEDGELAMIIQRKVTEAGRGIDAVLTMHLGDKSPLMALLSPGDTNQLITALRISVENTLRVQSDAIFAEFSLDNERGALRRLLAELTLKHGSLEKVLAERVGSVVEEFSLDNEDGALSRLVGQVRLAQERISNEFSLDNETSALSRLTKVVNQHNSDQRRQSQDFQERVMGILERMDTRRIEQARSTTHGIIFESALGDVLRGLSQSAGDVMEAVGNSSGTIRNNKVGDYVITLSGDSVASGARIVVEAKEEGSCRLAKTLQDADEARRNRDAGICLFVHSKNTAPADIPAFARYGNDLVVVWDAADPATDIRLESGLACARALCVRAARRSETDVASVQLIDRAVETIRKQIVGFEEITTSGTTAIKAGEKIVKRAEIMEREITAALATLGENIDALKKVTTD